MAEGGRGPRGMFMDRTLRRSLAAVLVAMTAPMAWPLQVAARPVEPATVLPMALVDPAFREAVSEVIRENHFHRRSEADVFPCDSRLYLGLVNDPALTLALWHSLAKTPARLQQVSTNRYQGTDGSGTTATWDFVLRSPTLHAMLCDLTYVGPNNRLRLDGRVLLVVRSQYFQDAQKQHWVKHDIEAFVKVDSRGWKAMARAARPIIEKLLEDQLQEAGWFVSLMGRLVETYPDWATQTVQGRPDLNPDTKRQFEQIVAQARKPNATKGRPAIGGPDAATAGAAPAQNRLGLPPYVSASDPAVRP